MPLFDEARPADAYIVVPPPSPSDTTPPLGPAILARAAAEKGLRVHTVDMNIKFLNRFRESAATESRLIGDQGKDRSLAARAASWLYQKSGLDPEDSLHAPLHANPVAGMHYSFDSIQRAVDTAASSIEWMEILENDVFSEIPLSARTVGISLMGPSQVFVGLLVLKEVKRRIPGVLTILGGSHPTLLVDEIRRDPRYRWLIDVVLPGHSEQAFVQLIQRRQQDQLSTHDFVVSAPLETSFSYRPLFTESQLMHYRSTQLTLPLQFTRGCVYGRCTYCTYPVVEPRPTAFDATAASDAIAELVSVHGVTKFSIKDSLFTVPMLTALSKQFMKTSAPAVRWSATTKISRALARAAPILAEAGLTTLDVGLESIDAAAQLMLDKKQDIADAEDIILTCARNKIVVVVNLIFGLPGEEFADAERQLRWYKKLRDEAPPGFVNCSLNMLEITRGSALAASPPASVQLAGIAPWAYCYEWNSPDWRREVEPLLRDVEISNPSASWNNSAAHGIVQR